MNQQPKIVALPPVEKSAQRVKLEKRIADFIGYVEEVNRLGRQIGRESLALDIMQGLTAFVMFADTGALRDITGIKTSEPRNADKGKGNQP